MSEVVIEVPVIEHVTKSNRIKQKGLNPKKKLMIELLKRNFGDVSKSTKDLKISRKTHYQWLKDDPLYKEAYDDIDDYLVDYTEHALMKLIDSGNVTAIIFFLKCKAKHKGYIEKQEIEHSSSEGIKFIIERQNERVSPKAES